MNFAEAMKDNPPRLVVLYKRSNDGSDEFQWGIVGVVPVLTIIGGIVGVQADLGTGEYSPGCDQCALVIAWDGASRDMQWFLHPDIPETPLVGMLECIKVSLVMGRLGQHAAAQRVESPVLGLDGNPIRC